MKKFLLVIPLLFFQTPALSQQVNQFGVCTQYQEVYVPGGYDQYGNYISGGVQTQSYNVPCNQVTGGNWNPSYQQRVCNPEAGAALGAGLAEALSGGNGWKYSSRYYNGRGRYNGYSESYRNRSSNGWTLFGAGLGALMFSC